MMQHATAAETWIENLRKKATFVEDGLPSENLLRLLLDEVRAADSTLPEFDTGHYRNGYGPNEIGFDGWGVEDDPTVGEEADVARAVRLHIIAFVDKDGIEDDTDTLTADAVEQSVHRTRQFFLRSGVRSKVLLYEEIAATAVAADAAEYIHLNFSDITEIQLHLLSDLPCDPSVDLSAYTEPSRVGETTMHVSILDRDRLYAIAESRKSAETEDIVLDLSHEDAAGVLWGHPVTAVGETGGWEVYVTAFTGPQLVRFYEQYKLKLVNENVRAFLQFAGATNKGIKKSIEEEPRRFISYNNGISIVASKVVGPDGEATDEDNRVELTHLLTIEGAQIVNGGQTTAALYHASQDPLLSQNIQDVRVFAKITVIPDAEEDEREAAIAKIARFSNTQNTIKSSDLESNWSFFRDLAVAADACAVPETGGGNAGTIWHFERSRGRYIETKRASSRSWANMRPETQVIDKVLLADVMNCVSERPYMAQKGGEGLIKSYLKWLRERNKVDGRFSDKTPRGFGFFGVNRYHGNADYDDLDEEWAGVVASVIVRRRLEEIFEKTDSWMRTIQIRYVLALSYKAFVNDDWLQIWMTQSADEFFGSLNTERKRGRTSFKEWATAAGDLVRDKVERLSKQRGTALNDLAKQGSTWHEVEAKAKREGLI
jgi:hypothetical protein